MLLVKAWLSSCHNCSGLGMVLVLGHGPECSALPNVQYTQVKNKILMFAGSACVNTCTISQVLRSLMCCLQLLQIAIELRMKTSV